MHLKNKRKEYISNCYKYVLGRKPSNEEVMEWYNSGVLDNENIRRRFIESEEFRRYFSEIAGGVVNYDEETLLIKKYSDHKAFSQFSWCIPCGGTLDPIKLGVLQNDIGLTSDVYEIEKIVSGLLEKNGKENVFLDLGANIGKFLFPFHALGWKCTAVEAANDNYEALKITCKINEIEMELLNNVIFDRSGTMWFYANGPYGMCAKSKDDFMHKAVFEGHEPIEIKSICLDDWKKNGLKNICNLGFIKMDVEGSEVAVIKGGNEFLNHFAYPIIFCESNKWTLYTQGETPKTLIEVFMELGYQPYIIDKGSILRIRDNYIQVECNTDFLFVHNSFNVGNVNDYCQNSEQVAEGLLKELYSDNVLEQLGSFYSIMKDSSMLAMSSKIRERSKELSELHRDDPIWAEALR